MGIDLDKRAAQSDGEMLTPFEQAKRYSDALPVSEKPPIIMTCNFGEFRIYDMDRSNPEEEYISIKIESLDKEYAIIKNILLGENKHIEKETEVSIKAGKLISNIYDAFLNQYMDDSSVTYKSLNILCVRLVFLMYCEDSEVFDKNQFHDYMCQFNYVHMQDALDKLFEVLSTKEKERNAYLSEDLAAFPYVNGGLFEQKVIIPRFTEDIAATILEASAEFDWSEINPTIFGAVFEGTLNPVIRRSGGMHYTSIENIHKVIDPLFLNDLRKELNEIKRLKIAKNRVARLKEYQDKLSKLTFLDPACGSGNFLTETYICLRKLENEVLIEKTKADKKMVDGQIAISDANYSSDLNVIQVSINQFYGIEINDFATSVAMTALWIAESQMMEKTMEIVNQPNDFLPLKTNTNIVEGNALEINWEDIVPSNKLDYIMGNPPFSGGMYMSKEQKREMHDIFTKEGKTANGVGEFDYVCAWYNIAANYIKNTSIQVCFVSTNSICQGEQVGTFWKYMFDDYNIKIDYAYTTFIWNNETTDPAKVHCVIVSFSNNDVKRKKILYHDNGNTEECYNINPYLTDGDNFFIAARSTPLCDVPPMRFGNMPRDNGELILTPEEKDYFINKEPLSKQWIKPYLGAREFLNNKERYCLWLVDAKPNEISQCPMVKKRIDGVYGFRSSDKRPAGTRKYASTPSLFCQIAQPDSGYIMFPKTSSGKRKYIPIGFMSKDVIASDLVFLIPNAGLYEFGILMSDAHNFWIKQVAGRLKSDYRYSKDIVYNNFPWASATPEQKAKIEKTAQGILDTREMFPDSTLADLYDKDSMPKELSEAHKANNKAVWEAYGKSWEFGSESECIQCLLKIYETLMRQ